MADRPSKGLAGIIAAPTAVSDIDGRAGLLFYRGHIAGWTAQVIARHAGNQLIRPASEYIGERGLTWTAWPSGDRRRKGGAISVTDQSADPPRVTAVPPPSQLPPSPQLPPARPDFPAPQDFPAPPDFPAPQVSPARARWWVQLPYWISLALVLAGLAWIWYGGSQRVRSGTLTLAGAMFIAAFARLVLPETRAALLVSRRRLADVTVLAVLAAGLLVVGLVLPAPL